MKATRYMKSLCLSSLIMFSTPIFADSSQTLADAAKDGWITTQVQSNLASNSVTSPANLSVETNNGVVTIAGLAPSDTVATVAVQIAESVKGVKDVNTDNLSVARSEQPLTDSYITAKVKGLFIQNNLLTNAGNVPLTSLKVETKNGVVYLSGSVKHPSQIQQAINLANTIDGVSNVKSSIRVG